MTTPWVSCPIFEIFEQIREGMEQADQAHNHEGLQLILTQQQ